LPCWSSFLVIVNYSFILSFLITLRVDGFYFKRSLARSDACCFERDNEPLAVVEEQVVFEIDN